MRKWFEIDDVNDLDIAINIFSENRIEETHARFGGFWRFEDKKDFTYLSNPYFPSEEFFLDIEANLRNLIHHYPSSQALNSKLMSAVLDVDEKYVVVGNGASEIIKIISDKYRNQAILSPTFKEYENRCETFTNISKMHEIEFANSPCVIIVNPNNPTGKLQPKNEILEALNNHPHKMIIVDESFMEFSEHNESLLRNAMIEKYPNLLIIKSIGKTHGIGGLRLGALVGQSAKEFKGDTPIWNINSIAEFFLQRFKKYEKSYLKSLKLIKNERKMMEERLSSLKVLHIHPSEGNFVYLDLDANVADKMQKFLFEKGFIIKLIEINNANSAIRLAVRNGLDNHLICTKIEEFVNEIN